MQHVSSMVMGERGGAARPSLRHPGLGWMRSLVQGIAVLALAMLHGCATPRPAETAQSGVEAADQSPHFHLPIDDRLARYIEANHIQRIDLTDESGQVHAFDIAGHPIQTARLLSVGGAIGRCIVGGVSRTCHLDGAYRNMYHNASGTHAGICPATAPCR